MAEFFATILVVAVMLAFALGTIYCASYAAGAGVCAQTTAC